MPRVHVVGGGLAGMTAATRLRERGCQVAIYDSADRMGGKAGARRTGDDCDEHGFHVFPKWYLNTWNIVDELELGDDFVDCPDYDQLDVDGWPVTKTLRNLTSRRFLWRNLRSRVLPTPEMFLFMYAVIDLASQPYSDAAFLDQNTLLGFLRSRYYRTDLVAKQQHDLLLKGISVPAYMVSAMTVRKVMQYWIRYPTPTYCIMKGNLQECLIDPFERRLRNQGCELHLRHQLESFEVADMRVSQLNFVTKQGPVAVDAREDEVVFAMPAERLAALVTDKIYAVAPTLADVRYLPVRPMAALNVYYFDRIPEIPSAHISLFGSTFGLMFIDVSQSWLGGSTTVLSIIASDSTALAGLSDDYAKQLILDELGRYIPPLGSARIRRCDFQSHIDQPLFSNEVGAWHYRLDALPDDDRHAIELENCHPAGDHCRSPIDLACMEGAVTSGLRAAEAVRLNLGLEPEVDICYPETPSQRSLVLARRTLFPVVLLAKLATSLRGWSARLRRAPNQ